MPRPQTFQPMRWACQPSQSSTPASSPCGISVSPLRGSFSTKTLRSGDALIPAGLLRRRSGSEAANWNVWDPGNCCPPGLHCRTAPAPAAPQRPRRSTALRAPGHGDAAPGAVQHPSKTGSSSWPQCPGPRRSSQCAGPASRARAARRQAALAGSAYRRCAAVFNKNSAQRRCADPTELPARARLAAARGWPHLRPGALLPARPTLPNCPSTSSTTKAPAQHSAPRAGPWGCCTRCSTTPK